MTILPATIPTHDHDGDRLANDPRIAAIASVFANAMIAALSPWLARLNAPTNHEIPTLLSVDQARAYCGGMPKSTWSDFNSRGVIPAAVRIGGRVFWRRVDLDAWVEQKCPGRIRFGVGTLETPRFLLKNGAVNTPNNGTWAHPG